MVQFDEPSENAVFLILRNSAAGIGHVTIDLLAAQFVAEPDTSLLGKFDRIGYQIDQQLGKPVSFGANRTFGQRPFERQFHPIRLQAHPHHAFLLLHQFVQIEIRIDEFERSGFDLRQIENVADQLQQQCVVVLDNADVLLLLLLRIGQCQNPRETDDRIQRRPDFVAHISEESRLEPVGLFRPVFGRHQLLLHLLPLGNHLRRTDQHQRFARSIPCLDGRLRLHPLLPPTPAFADDHPVLLLHFRYPAFRQIPVSAAHPFPVFPADFGEILRIRHGKLLFPDIAVRPPQFDRPVHIAQNGAFPQVPLPRNDAGYLQGHRQLLVRSGKFLLHVVKLGAVQAKYVYNSRHMRTAQHHLVERVDRLKIVSKSNAPPFGDRDPDKMQEFGHRLGKNFASLPADSSLLGIERPFERPVHVAEHGIDRIAGFVQHYTLLHVYDRHVVEQVRIVFTDLDLPQLRLAEFL